MAPELTNRDIAAHYLQSNFAPDDRLTVVLIHKRTGAVLQRLGSAEQIASPDFQAWLRHKNAQEHEVYVSMNALREDARGRTKADIAAIRHVYLDFDDHGTQAVDQAGNDRALRQGNSLAGARGRGQHGRELCEGTEEEGSVQ